MEKICINAEELRLIYSYALSHCKEVCPQDRDPKACLAMMKIGKLINIFPPCVKSYGYFKKDFLKKMLKEIEVREGRNIKRFIEEMKHRTPRNLQEYEDSIDSEFIYKILKILEGEENA